MSLMFAIVCIHPMHGSSSWRRIMSKLWTAHKGLLLLFRRLSENYLHTSTAATWAGQSLKAELPHQKMACASSLQSFHENTNYWMRTNLLYRQKFQNCCVKLIKHKWLKTDFLQVSEDLHLFPEYSRHIKVNKQPSLSFRHALFQITQKYTVRKISKANSSHHLLHQVVPMFHVCK